MQISHLFDSKSKYCTYTCSLVRPSIKGEPYALYVIIFYLSNRIVTEIRVIDTNEAFVNIYP